MDNKELLRRLALLKANPKLADTLPQAEVFKVIQDVVSAFNVLKTAIDNGKIKGETGYTPIPDVDYPSLTRYDKSIEETITALETNYSYALDLIEKKLSTVKDGVDGKDAIITDEDKAEIAELAYSLLSLPDFEALVATEIPRHGEAIRDALELLQGDARYKVEIPDVQGLEQALNDLALIRGKNGGGIGRTQVYEFIRQAVNDGTIPSGGVPNGGTTGQVLTKLSNTDGDADWQDPAGGTGAVDSVNGQTGVVVLDADDISDAATTNKFATAAEKTKLGHISVTQAVDLDAIEAASHAAATVTDSTSIDLILTGQDITAQREALTGAITASKNSNTTALGSFTRAQLDTAVSDANVMYIGDAPTAHTHTLANITDVTMTVANLNSLDDGVDTTLHFHASDRNRANHTGTQLASTISDFAATVRSTVLTGLSLASTTVISATDTVLVALGSLQAQITALTTTAAAKVASVTAGTNVTVTGTATAPVVNVPTMTATVGGAVPTPPNNTTTFLRGDGTFAAPSSGFADPLTTNGDIIARVSGSTTRLAQGANDTFLGVSGGVLGYFTPPGVGSGITEAQARAIARRYAIALG